MHGDKSQGQRERALANFEAGVVDTLVATDVAARGIDVAGITPRDQLRHPRHPRGLRAPHRAHRPRGRERRRRDAGHARPGARAARAWSATSACTASSRSRACRPAARRGSARARRAPSRAARHRRAAGQAGRLAASAPPARPPGATGGGSSRRGRRSSPVAVGCQRASMAPPASANVARMSTPHPPDQELELDADAEPRGGRVRRRPAGPLRHPAPARAQPGPADADGHEHLGGRARAGVGRRPGPAAGRASGAAVRRRSRRAAASAASCSRTTITTTPRPWRRCCARHPAPLAAGRGEVDVPLGDGARFGPFEAVATPGHASDHFALVAEGACFTGDAVLGSGSVFISPHPRRHVRLPARAHAPAPARGLQRAVPRARPAGVGRRTPELEEYVAHRIDRENRLIAALGEGRRTVERAARRRSGPTCPSRCARPPRRRSPPIWTSSRKSRSCPAGVERPRFERIEW